jgi:hypothetical protein
MVTDAMSVTECQIPLHSGLDRRVVRHAYFKDAYRVPLRRDGSLVEIFFAIFGHHPWWAKRLLIARHKVAALFGLQTPSAAQVIEMKNKGSYQVGDTIGVWPIFALTDNELIAGRNDRHLDFRMSLLRDGALGGNGEQRTVTVSTVCDVRNTAGKLYLFLIAPFHRWGVRRMLTNAVAAGRL